MNFYECVTTVLCVASVVALFYRALKHEISIMRERERLDKAFKYELIETLKKICEAVTQKPDAGAGS